MRKQSDKLKVVGLPNNWLEVFKTVDDMEDKDRGTILYYRRLQTWATNWTR